MKLQFVHRSVYHFFPLPCRGEKPRHLNLQCRPNASISIWNDMFSTLGTVLLLHRSEPSPFLRDPPSSSLGSPILSNTLKHRLGGGQFFKLFLFKHRPRVKAMPPVENFSGTTPVVRMTTTAMLTEMITFATVWLKERAQTKSCERW